MSNNNNNNNNNNNEQQHLNHVKDVTFVDSTTTTVEGGVGDDDRVSLSLPNNNNNNNNNNSTTGGGSDDGVAYRGITKPAAAVRAFTHDGVSPSFSNNNNNNNNQLQHSDGEHDDDGSSGGLKKSESTDKIGTLGPSAPKKLKKIGKPPSRPRLSIDALGPLIVDRTELQSPIKLEHEIPEVARIVVASIQVDLEKKREASHRNLAALANADVSIPPSLATANPPATSAPAAAVALDTTKSPPTHAPATPSFITQVTQPSAPVQRPNISAAVKKAGMNISRSFSLSPSPT